MRHRAKVSTFGRKTGPRKALLRGLVHSLVEHGRIKTTLAKAKELRRHVERAITMGKKGTLHSRRILMSRYPNENTVSTIMTDLAPRFQTRPGGYTRILKLGQRPGDRAEMAFIEFVDFDPSAPKVVDEKAVQAHKKTVAHAAEAKKKRIRKFQEASRRINRL
jgi:large subunit ribosomal protein L17